MTRTSEKNAGPLDIDARPMDLTPWFKLEELLGFYAANIGKTQLTFEEFAAIRMAGNLRPWKVVN